MRQRAHLNQGRWPAVSVIKLYEGHTHRLILVSEPALGLHAQELLSAHTHTHTRTHYVRHTHRLVRVAEPTRVLHAQKLLSAHTHTHTHTHKWQCHLIPSHL